jgi:hypothetical protein
MLAPLIIHALIASMLLLFAGWLSDTVGQLLRYGCGPEKGASLNKNALWRI